MGEGDWLMLVFTLFENTTQLEDKSIDCCLCFWGSMCSSEVLSLTLSLRHFWHLFPAPATLLYDPYPPTANHNNPRLSCRPALLCFTLGLTDSQSAVGDTWTFCCILHFWAHGNEDRNMEFSRMKMRCDYGEIYIVNQGLITHKRKCLPERMIAGSYSFHTWLARCYTDISVLIYLFIYLFLLSFH